MFIDLFLWLSVPFLLWSVFGSALGDYYGLGWVLVWSNRAGLFADLHFGVGSGGDIIFECSVSRQCSFVSCTTAGCKGFVL